MTAVEEERRSRPWPTVVRSVTVVTACMLPVFLTGALAVQIAGELGLDPTRLGLVAACYFGIAAITSVPAGTLVDRIGPTCSSRLAAGGAGICLLLIATVTQSFTVLLVLVACAGWCNSLGNLACNVTLARVMPTHRLGISFGIKQSAVPLATLMAGAMVPAFATTIGWRWAFAVGAVLALIGVFLSPRIAMPEDGGERRAARANGALAMIAIASCLASACATMLSIFLVSSAVAQGIEAGLAGLSLTLGSVAGLVGRLLNGWLADRRRGGHITAVAACLIVGAIGIGLLAVPGSTSLVLGTILGFGLGFSWQGLLQFAVVRLHPAAPAAASAIVQLGANAGNFVGPIGFGILASRTTFPVAFAIAACLELVAAAGMFLGRRMLLAHRMRTEG